MPRDFQSEYQNYHSKPGAKKQRARNNAARRKMIQAGRASVGDGKDVAHRNNKTTDNSLGNLSLQSPSKNRSFNRTKTARRKKA